MSSASPAVLTAEDSEAGVVTGALPTSESNAIHGSLFSAPVSVNVRARHSADGGRYAPTGGMTPSNTNRRLLVLATVICPLLLFASAGLMLKLTPDLTHVHEMVGTVDGDLMLQGVVPMAGDESRRALGAVANSTVVAPPIKPKLWAVYPMWVDARKAVDGFVKNSDTGFLRVLLENTTHWRQTAHIGLADLVVVHPNYPRVTGGTFNQQVFRVMKPSASCNRFPATPRIRSFTDDRRLHLDPARKAFVGCDIGRKSSMTMCLRNAGELLSRSAANTSPFVSLLRRRFPRNVTVESIHPPAFILNLLNTAEMTSELRRMTAFQESERSLGKLCRFIVKPNNGEGGRGIFVAESAEHVIGKLLSHRGTSGSVFLAQHLIDNPLRLSSGHNRFDVRVYFLLTSQDPLVVYFNRRATVIRLASAGRRASAANDSSTTSAKVFLTNYSFHHDKSKLWRLSAFEDVMRHANRTNAWEGALALMRRIAPFAIGLHGRTVHRRGSFHLFGCDFVLDDHFGPWFIECNKVPMIISIPVCQTAVLVVT